MTHPHCSLLPRRAAVFLALGLGSTASCVLLLLRYAAIGRVGFPFLVWNLFLAWIPLGLALLAWRAFHSRPRGSRSCRMPSTSSPT
jgi:hypothetical protein